MEAIFTAADAAGNAAQNNGVVTGTLFVLGIIAIAGEVVDKGVMVYDLAMAAYYASNGNTAAAMSHAKDLALACVTDGLPFNAAGVKAIKLLKKLGAGDLAAKFAAKFGISESSDFVRYADFSHVDELAKNGIKHNPEDILFTHKMPDGKIVFLEKGYSDRGLKHIIKEHGDQFEGKGISVSELPEFIYKAVKDGKVVGYQGTGAGRPIYEVVYKGKRQKVAITIGGNGFVVGANPKSIK